MNRLIFTVLVCTTFSFGSAFSAQLVFNSETAGISGFPEYWNKPVTLSEDGATRASNHGSHGAGPVADWSTDKPGAIVFDAVHRRLLLRFPDAAAAVAEKLREGHRVVKAEVQFEFIDTEFFPMDYRLPSGMSFLGDLWVRKPPRWHAVAHLLRQPWHADGATGPTFNASVNGRRYWAEFGAQNEEHDRFPQQFGPAEVSHQNTTGLMDVSEVLSNDAYGTSLAERLQVLSEQGLIVRKWETYDALYNHGGYEYGGAPGHRGIRTKAPKLIVTLEPVPEPPSIGTLPEPRDIAQLPPTGNATAVMPDTEKIQQFIKEHGIAKPDGMPAWQWDRVQTLLKLSPKQTGFPASPEAYLDWLKSFMRMPYRQFTGHHTPLTTHDCLLYAEAWPAPVREHMQKYWDAWLMPGRPYTELQHNQWGIWTSEANSYYNRTGDWRGNHSFYRESYARFMSTMNFNHNATMGALLGGAFTDNAQAIEDGRFGLETILLRLWSWYDGTTQESIDHYYLGLTLYGQKSFADLGPTQLDRLMGKSMLLKTMDELASCYHPALKRFIATGGRTGIAELLAINEGPNHILHTVSKKGALHDIENPDRLGMPAVGRDCPPNLVGQQTLVGPWMPLWMGNIVDDKPLPFEMTASFRVWGSHNIFPLWKRSYQSTHYGLATLDVLGGNETFPIMAQWRRTPGETAAIQEIGTLLMRFGINDTEFYDTLYHGTKQSNANGSVGTQGGFTAAVQHENKAILLTSPYEDLAIHGRAAPSQVQSFQSTIALANYQANPTWKLYIDGKAADLSKLPIRAGMASRITIHDGVTYIGILPVPATDFGRNEEILITDGGEPVDLQGGGKAAPTLLINNYHYLKPDTPFPYGEELKKHPEQMQKLARAYSGFILEMGDSSQYESFEAFQTHFASTKLSHNWNVEKDLVDIVYVSGEDRFETGFRPHYKGGRWGQKAPTNECFPYRRVNGEWPYLADGLERDSTVGQQGTRGRLEKNGAVLRHQPGRMGYLLTEPVSGNFLFANPLPDPQHMIAQLPQNIRIEADGQLGLMHLLANPKQNTVEISYAVKDGQAGPKMAEGLYIFGTAEQPGVTLNGTQMKTLEQVDLGSRPAWRIPLTKSASSNWSGRYEMNVSAREKALDITDTVDASMRYLPGQEHYLLTQPSPTSYSFWRLWPTPSPIEVSVPGGVRVATDGNLALQRIIVSPEDNKILVDYAPYLQTEKDGKPIPDRAKVLVVSGMAQPPEVILHGQRYQVPEKTVSFMGREVYVIPLFDDPLGEVVVGLEKRYIKAMKQLQM